MWLSSQVVELVDNIKGVELDIRNHIFALGQHQGLLDVDLQLEDVTS